ncbi:hypothetical protein QF026_003889 [Streptomyces aurantiacus]|uniref:hypothetical protein n=1 Tax=Streptomyces aurantiacus TaxID=47760 RepID=UPI002790FC2B|nr:hypothetical protein [Streptomyces aurantiacus]MDQ0775423.1 hypothetical protein [Streptomyces aurantiacus]
MMTSSTLAIGTSAGTLTVSLGAAVVTGVLAAYTLSHHRQVFAWLQRMRHKDRANAELDKPDQWLSDLYEVQCRLAQKPCRTADFEDIAQVTNMIKGVVDHAETIGPDLTKVVERVEEYLATALPETDFSAATSLPEHRSQLSRAMKQENARNELTRAVVTAQRRITLLRRG